MFFIPTRCITTHFKLMKISSLAAELREESHEKDKKFFFVSFQQKMHILMNNFNFTRSKNLFNFEPTNFSVPIIEFYICIFMLKFYGRGAQKNVFMIIKITLSGWRIFFCCLFTEIFMNVTSPLIFNFVHKIFLAHPLIWI